MKSFYHLSRHQKVRGEKVRSGKIRKEMFQRKISIEEVAYCVCLKSITLCSCFSPCYCVCVKRITLCNCLCSFSTRFSACRVRNIGASHIRDFGPSHGVKGHVCCHDSLTHQKTDSAISKNNSSVRPGLSLEKSYF